MAAAFRGMDRRRGLVVAGAGGVAWIVGAVAAAAGREAAVAILEEAARGLVVGVAGFVLAAAVAAAGTAGEAPAVAGASHGLGRTRRRIPVAFLDVGAGRRAHAARALGDPDRALRGAVAVAVSGAAIVGVSSRVALGGVAGLAGVVLALDP